MRTARRCTICIGLLLPLACTRDQRSAGDDGAAQNDVDVAVDVDASAPDASMMAAGARAVDARTAAPSDAAAIADARGPIADTGGGGMGATDAPRAVASCAAALLCDGFESYTDTLAGPWTVGTPSSASSRPIPGTSLQVDGSNAFSGAKSVHIRSAGGTAAGNGGDTIVMRTMKGLPVAKNHVFGRAMMYFHGPWPRNHIRLVGMLGTDPHAGYMLNGGGSFGLEALTDNWGGGGWVPMVTEKWTCVEWEFDAPVGGAVVARVWIDGKEVLPNPKGYPHVDMLRLWIGYSTATKSPPVEMWVDDVALGTERVGCPAAK